VSKVLAVLLFGIKRSNKQVNVLLCIACCRDVAVSICVLKKLQALENFAIKAVSALGSCTTTARECMLGGCS
jgi:hypothetical protein